MFIAVYRWRIKAGMEEQFREGWRLVTESIYRTYGSLGSRLHRDMDGSWVAYAQWPDRKHWERAQREGPVGDKGGLQMMRDSVESPADVEKPAFRLMVTDDLLQPAPWSEGG